jgi:hypothetical protein
MTKDKKQRRLAGSCACQAGGCRITQKAAGCDPHVTELSAYEPGDVPEDQSVALVVLSVPNGRSGAAASSALALGGLSRPPRPLGRSNAPEEHAFNLGACTRL